MFCATSGLDPGNQYTQPHTHDVYLLEAVQIRFASQLQFSSFRSAPQTRKTLGLKVFYLLIEKKRADHTHWPGSELCGSGLVLLLSFSWPRLFLSCPSRGCAHELCVRAPWSVAGLCVR